MKVLCLTKYDNIGASSRVRSLQYIPFLENHGIEIHVSALLDNAYIQNIYNGKKNSFWYLLKQYLMRLKVLLRAKSYDCIWIEKEVFSFLPFIAERWFLKRVNYIVDYDDAIFHNYDRHSNFLVRKLLGKKIAKVMKSANCVVAGNQYLANYANKAGAKNIKLIPTVVDMNKYLLASNTEKHPKIIVGWIGTPKTMHYLNDIVISLQNLSKQHAIALHIMGVKHYEVAGLEVQCFPWSEESEVAFVQSIDIGVMPLIDSAFERGKCGYKLIQYMAVGKPVVASPVGVNVEIVEPEVNGYLASEQLEWQGALTALCENDEKRKKMGYAGHEKVLRQYSIQAVIEKLVAIIKSCKDKTEINE